MVTLATNVEHLRDYSVVWAAVLSDDVIPPRDSSYISCQEAAFRGTKNEWGYPNKTWKGRKYQIRKVAFLVKFGRLPTEDISHGCSNENCINKDHVYDEPNRINQTRKCCAEYLGNPATPDYVCPHAMIGRPCIPRVFLE